MDDFKQHPPNSNQIDTEHHRPDFLHPETEPIHKDDGDSIHNSERELARKRKQEKAEVRKKFLKIGGVVAIVLLGLFNLPIPLGSIKVIGSDKVTVQDVEVAGDIGEPVNVLRINRENLRYRLSKDLRIEDAQIGYELPLTMVVRVVERKAIAVIPAQFGYLTLDKNGQVIASDSVIEDTSVPMISGVKGGNI
ncbi:MAG: FtsQ-type POTRA domain-containing protein, partial [Veillonella sp.]|uniref:cell division protein FtsQ/DivIB n=1 Tax=Veillonella sp. TaxID=1926307 RepID=UPI0029124F41